jgi:hypothetical protein
VIEVPAWRVAWFHPRRGHWVLGLYEYRDQTAATALAEWLRGQSAGIKAESIPCVSYQTDHGVDAP